MALGPPLSTFGLVCIACCCLECRAQPSTLTPREAPLAVIPSEPAGKGGSNGEVPHRSSVGEPKPGGLFLVKTTRAELVLRALGTNFERVLASNTRHLLYDPALELVWFSAERDLWVVDLRALAAESAPSVEPVLIAKDVPEHVELHVVRNGVDFVEPDDACDLAPYLLVQWEQEPSIEVGPGQRATHLEGRSWLANERARVARLVPAERWFHPTDPHVALPAARARCDEPERCGAALPFAEAGWELVLTQQTQGADCWQWACLFHDPATNAFATPPEPRTWSSADVALPGSCGPYRFNLEQSAFLVKDLVCTVRGRCHALGGWGVGWLLPGPMLGAP